MFLYLTDPTIQYLVDGDESGHAYQGGRDFDSLKQHVVDKLEAKCTVNDPTECTDKEKKYIEKMKGTSAEERAKQLARLDKMKGDSMKGELKQWLTQRLRILQQMEEKKDEL